MSYEAMSLSFRAVQAGHQSLSQDQGTRIRPWDSLEIDFEIKLKAEPTNHYICEPMLRYRFLWRQQLQCKKMKLKELFTCVKISI